MKKIQRIADGKYLLNVVSDTWVDTIEEAKTFRQGELMIAKMKLFNRGVKPEDIQEINA